MTTSTVTGLTKLGHACVLLETAAGRHILLDPGDLAGDLAGLPPLDAILITHAHPDHADPAKLAQAAAGRHEVLVVGAPGTEATAAEAGLTNFAELVAGEHELAGVAVRVADAEHATIYPGFPLVPNLSLTIDDRIYTPGDSFAPPAGPVDTLLAPAGGPWMKLAEAIDFIRAVRPSRMVPIHDGGLAPAHRALHLALMTRFAPEGTVIQAPELGERLAL